MNPLDGLTWLVLLHLALVALGRRRMIIQFLDDCSNGNVERLERERRGRAIHAARARAVLSMMHHTRDS